MCEYCLIWALNKSILLGSKSLKVSVLCDMNSPKSFYYSLILNKLSENCQYFLEKCIVLFASNSENVGIAWCKLWKSV